jgi:hypothetical protein
VHACAQAAGLVDELTTCWAMISLGRCAGLARDMEITVVGALRLFSMHGALQAAARVGAPLYVDIPGSSQEMCDAFF